MHEQHCARLISTIFEQVNILIIQGYYVELTKKKKYGDHDHRYNVPCHTVMKCVSLVFLNVPGKR